MTDSVVKVGDVVAWNEVPPNTLILWRWQYHQNEYYVKDADGSARVCDDGIWVPAKRLNGGFTNDDSPVEIIKMGLRGNESADELRALAEAFHRDHSAA